MFGAQHVTIDLMSLGGARVRLPEHGECPFIGPGRVLVESPKVVEHQERLLLGKWVTSHLGSLHGSAGT